MSEKGLLCAFIAGMPKSIEELLWALFQVDNMEILKVQAWAILKTGPMTMEQAAAAQPSQCQTKETDSPITSYKCRLRHKPIQKVGTTPKIPVPCYRYKKARTYSPGVSRKWIRRQKIGTSFFTESPVNGALSMVSVHINGKKRTALVDTGYTQTLVCKLCCQTWERKVFVLTVGRSLLICCGVCGLNWYWQWAPSRCTNSGCW